MTSSCASRNRARQRNLLAPIEVRALREGRVRELRRDVGQTRDELPNVRLHSCRQLPRQTRVERRCAARRLGAHSPEKRFTRRYCRIARGAIRDVPAARTIQQGPAREEQPHQACDAFCASLQQTSERTPHVRCFERCVPIVFRAICRDVGIRVVQQRSGQFRERGRRTTNLREGERFARRRGALRGARAPCGRGGSAARCARFASAYRKSTSCA